MPDQARYRGIDLATLNMVVDQLEAARTIGKAGTNATAGAVITPTEMSRSAPPDTIEPLLSLILSEVRRVGETFIEVQQRLQHGHLSVIEETGNWPQTAALPQGWTSIDLHVSMSAIPQDTTLWNPWEHTIPAQEALIALNRSTLTLVVARATRLCEMDWRKLFPDIPVSQPVPTEPPDFFPLIPDNRWSVSVVVSDTRLYCRSRGGLVEFIGVRAIQTTTEEWAWKGALSGNGKNPKWDRVGLPIVRNETRRRLTMIAV